MLIDYCDDDVDKTKGTGYEQITPRDIKQFIASHYTPDRMVLAGVGVDHDQFVELAEKHFVDPVTTWDSSDMVPVDGSISQYTGGHCKVSIKYFTRCFNAQSYNILYCCLAIDDNTVYSDLAT